MVNEIEQKEQIFFCIDKQGFMAKIRPENLAEKQQMCNSFSEYIQIGFRSQDNIKIQFSDNSTRLIDPGSLRIGKKHFLSKIKKVQAFWLEPKKTNEVKPNANTNTKLQKTEIWA